jgi:hypothetical protein
MELPLFAQWGQTYGGLHPDDLPFDSGEGLGELADLLEAAESPSPPAAPENGISADDAALWQAALEELSLQMTRATYDAWLRDARLVACHQDEYVVAVSGPQAKEWLENRLDVVIQRTVQMVSDGRVRGVTFTL